MQEGRGGCPVVPAGKSPKESLVSGVRNGFHLSVELVLGVRMADPKSPSAGGTL